MHRNFQIKRVYETAFVDDGYRILVDRLWPRGLKKEDAMLDEWNKEIAPSTELRKWFDHQPEKFEEFCKRYREELMAHQDDLKRLKEIAGERMVSLLYAAKDSQYNNAAVLMDLLTGKTKKLVAHSGAHVYYESNQRQYKNLQHH